MKANYQEPNSTLYCGHAIDVLKELEAGSVDCVPTSPPYWGLRSYKTEPLIWGDNHCEHEWGSELVKSINLQAGNPEFQRQWRESATDKQAGQGNFCLKCGAWKGELGLEPTIELYISHLLLIFDEVKRVLKKTGTLWVNIGDSYSGSGKASGQSIEQVTAKQASNFASAHLVIDSGIPAKSLCLIPERFALAMVENGWILRNDIVWNKPNPMPESVKDRFTGSWEHLFFFVKSKRYWFEQQFDQYTEPLNRWGGDSTKPTDTTKDNDGVFAIAEREGRNRRPNELGRNKRDVWEINTQPYPEAHFAVFPEKLVETPILAGCPQDGVVLDPFAGAGTTGAVAKRLGRKYIGIELSPKYCKLHVKRLQSIPLAMEL